MADIDTILIFLTQNIGNIDIDILYCSALWPTNRFHYHHFRQHSEHTCSLLTTSINVTSMLGLFLNFRFGLIEM